MNQTSSYHNGEGNTESNQNTKTYSVYHVENYDSGFDEYHWGNVEAKDINEAEEKAIYEFLTISKKDVSIEGIDEKESYIEYDTQFFDENGNEIEQDENNDDQSYITHSLRIVENINEEEDDQ